MGTYQVLLTLLSLFAIGSAPQTAGDPLKIEGVVVNSVNGRPVPRALVELNSDRAVLTGPEGEFSFDNVPPGAVQLGVTKPGYFVPGTKTRGMPGVVQAVVGSDSRKLVVKLAPEAVIWGRVTGHDEQPLEGVQIQALSPYSSDGLRQISFDGSTQTDEDGNYRIANLPAGRYLIRVNATDATRRILGARSTKSDESYATVYYPGSPGPDSAAGVDLVPGQRLEASFSLSPVPAYHVSGVVVTSGEWKQISPPLIMDAMGQVLLTVDKFDLASRAFEFRAVPAGSHVLRTVGQDRQDHSVFSDQPIAVSRSVTGLNLTLHPGVDIPVVVTTQFAKQRGGCGISFTHSNGEVKHSDCSDLPAAHVELIAMSSSPLHFGTEFGQQPDPSHYGIHAVPPGKYMVRARANVGGYIQSVRCGSQDLLREPLVVPPGGTVGAIEVTVRDDSGALKVEVRAEKPLEQGLIVLVADGGLFTEPQIIGSARGWEFHYGPLAPGNYKVFAFDSPNGIDYSSPGALAGYESKAARIRVGANDRATVAVDLIRTGE